MAIPKTLKAIEIRDIKITTEDDITVALRCKAKIGQVYSLHNEFELITGTTEDSSEKRAKLLKDFIIKVIKQGNEDDEDIESSINALFDAHYNQIMLKTAQAYGFLPKDNNKVDSMIETAKN